MAAHSVAMPTRIYFQHQTPDLAGRFRTGVSLHSHTLHSRESLGFLYQAARRCWLLRWVVRHGEQRYQAVHGRPLDLNRGWWTPPLAPLHAFRLEAAQIEELGLEPIVSLTDHDDIEAPISLQALEVAPQAPISVEWTVPYGETFFHLGVHNLAPPLARAAMERMKAFTAAPSAAELTSILAIVSADPATLIVFNHPLWDEKGAGRLVHQAAALELLRTHGRYLHAVELNGLRPWAENRAALQLAREWGKPAISGGDRHAIEPNAMLNLTRAASFAEFAQEIRRGHSEVLVMPQYGAPHAARIFHNLLDVFRTYEDHGCGWRHWADRVFYAGESGPARPLSQLWGERPPAAVALFAGAMQVAGHPNVRHALRAMLVPAPLNAE